MNEIPKREQGPVVRLIPEGYVQPVPRVEKPVRAVSTERVVVKILKGFVPKEGDRSVFVNHVPAWVKRDNVDMLWS